jgi:putative nucleotidyltransferase with HDIG domain
MLFLWAVSNFLIYRFILDSEFNQLREKLKIIAQTAALMFDADMITRVHLSREGINSTEYRVIADKLRNIKNINKPIRYIYIMSKTEHEGIWQFVVDPDALLETESKKSPTSYPGDKYNAARFPEMLKAFYGPSADKKLVVDEWGITLSGYAPIRDKSGKAIAILGVDVVAEDVYKIHKEADRRSLLLLLLGIILSTLLASIISRRVVRPIKKLAQGTRNLAEGNLRYQVEVEGSDEISELAHSFNKMAISLYKSRRRFQNYFYRVIQSLVKILEARDSYMKGHSERVSGYAEKIARKMGLPEEKVELLKEVSMLHDIGKLGIQENILNKKEKLTEEEWEIIRKHPLIGEEVLRPILLDEEMITMIRSHHERYDGGGYPDKLSGENINIFSQILSVADAYDAMSSLRAYRPNLSKKEAMEELRKNSGTQFNSDIVNIFIKILEEEP